MNTYTEFDLYLSEHQKDMVKIINKHRKAYHKLSVEEIASEANLLLLKDKDKIIETLGKEFNQNNFKRMSYAYIRNAINWSNYRAINSKDGKMQNQILDAMHTKDDETVTTFELAVDKNGHEDELEIFSNKHSFKNFIHVLTKYYYLLSSNEIKLLSYIQKGLNQYEISEKMQVTHQAISFAIIGLKQKVKSQFNFNDIYNQKQIKGQASLEALFS